MSKQSNEEVIKLIKADIDTQDNYEKLYKQNRGFIYQVIKRRVHGIYECDDLLQQSYFALVKAVEYYDYEREEKAFLQILKYSIWNEIRSLTSDIPAHMQDKIVKYRMTYDKLYNELYYKPKAFQIMLEMNISLKELETIRAAMRLPLSFDEPVGENGDSTRLDLYAESRADEDIEFDSSLEKQELKSLLQEAISKLPENSQDVIHKRYFNNWTLEKCGQELNVTRERVRQVESKALRVLRKDYELKRKLDEYISDYKYVGINQFNNTRTSSTEWVVLEREKRLEEWKNQKYKEMLKEIKGFENLL